MQFSKIALVATAALGMTLYAQAPSDNAVPQQNQTQQNQTQQNQTQQNQTQQSSRQLDPQKQLDHLSRKLALTADQQNQILPILTSRQQQVSAIESDSSLDQKQRRAKLAAVREDTQSRLRNVLTDAQRAAYDQMQQQARERAKAKRQGSVS